MELNNNQHERQLTFPLNARLFFREKYDFLSTTIAGLTRLQQSDQS